VTRARRVRNRERSQKKINLSTPKSGTATNMDDAWAIAKDIGRYPLIIRPAFTLGGTGGGIAYNPEEFEQIVKAGIFASATDQVLVEQSLLGWKEYELEVMRDLNDNCMIGAPALPQPPRVAA
jgi:carbamoyl-phosphate synthase large subunit